MELTESIHMKLNWN